MNSNIHYYEENVRSCFQGSVQSLWYGGEDPVKIGTNPNYMYVAITEDENWYKNCCILRDWFFDYESFKKLPLEMDCVTHGVFVFWMK